MKIAKFSIKNFKGISDTTISVGDGAPGNVVTLIGLNESGKTTILEALSYFATEDADTAELVRTVWKKSSIQDIVPKDKKAAFTGRISIKAFVELADSDVAAIADFLLKQKGLILDSANISKAFTVESAYTFEDSKHKASNVLWAFGFDARTPRQKNFTRYVGTASAGLRAIWVDVVNFVRPLLPQIVYFPTFLFDFPDRIYLDDDHSEINSYYMQVIQDVLDSQGEGLTIQKHIIDRIASVQTEHPAIATFLAFFFQKDEKKQIDAVLQKASNEMSTVIFGSWNSILGRDVKGKRVQIEWLLDGEKNNTPYLEVSIVDGQSKYSLSERSLGFRWFFSFLLFTQFRKNRKSDRATIFLFDEPAANLHSKAQIKLLETFSKIAHGSTYIIYSTHSHYMVNPLWLEKAYIVENKATDYENDDLVDSFAVRKTDISAVRYKTFVGSSPTKTTYFQPVLDALDVAFSPLITARKAVIVEGKTDYYPLVFYRRKFGAAALPAIFPANGAGGSSALIGLFRGWGVEFCLLLDDDRAGKQAKSKYQDEFLLSEREVVTLGEIVPELSGKELEDAYQDDVTAAVKAAFTTESPSKKQYSLYFQELAVSGKSADFPQTDAMFQKISEWIDKKFE